MNAFETSLALAGSAKEGLNNVGSACADAGLVREALGFYQRSVETDPEYGLGLRNLAVAAYQLTEYATAIESIDTVIRLGEATAPDIGLGADARIASGQTDEAIQFLIEEAKKEPENTEYFRRLGLIYLNEMQDYDIASKYFEHALSIDPNQRDLRQLIRQLAMQRANPAAPLASPGFDPLTNLFPDPVPGVPQIPSSPGAPGPP